jgi:hypothetical protein
MILDDKQVLDIIANRPNKKLIAQAQKYTEKLMMHIKGVGMDKYIDRIMAFEKEDLIKIRKAYAVSNKAMFTRVNRPVDKVYSAKGGSVYYNLGDGPTKKLKDYLSNLAEGYTIKQWLEAFYMPATGYDPMGMIMMEIDSLGNPYPTYKSIMDVFEYQPRNRNLEYIIFRLDPKDTNLPVKTDPDKPVPLTDGDGRILAAVKAGEGTKADLYRVVDDAFDRVVRIENGNLYPIPDETYPNYWGKVPASLISNIYDPVLGMFLSTEDSIVELADQFLRDGSVKNIIMQYHGFPRAWEYQSQCPECKGTKVLNGRPCDYCKGTGVKSQSFPEETIRIPVPKSQDEPKLAPDLGGYITPPIDGIKLYCEQLEALEDLMFETKWGTHMADDTKKGGSETATGKFIDTQPVNDRLNKYSDAAEMMETFVTDMVAQIIISQSYQGASVTYGRRFLIETPDEIWEKLQKSIGKAPFCALMDLYNDYLQARYSSNAMEMQKMLKLALIEPLPFVNYVDFARLQTFPDVILRQKFWWERWMRSKTDPEILYGDVAALQADFAKFCVDQDNQLNLDVQKNTAINTLATPPPEPAKPGEPEPTPGKPAQKQAA